MKNTSLSLLARFNSGHPLTRWDSIWGGMVYNGYIPTHTWYEMARNPEYGSTTPWRFTIDMKIDKTVNVGKTGKLTFFVYVQNPDYM